jgi:hypothetical protein
VTAQNNKNPSICQAVFFKTKTRHQNEHHINFDLAQERKRPGHGRVSKSKISTGKDLYQVPDLFSLNGGSFFDPFSSRSFYYLDTIQTSGHFEPIFDRKLLSKQNDTSSPFFAPKSLSRRNGLRQAVVNFADRFRTIDPALRDRIRDCGHRVFWYETNCSHHYSSRISSVRYCGHRLCPACAKRRSIKDIKHIGGGLSKYAHEHKLYPHLLTLTLENTPKLPDRKNLSLWRKYFFRSSILKSIGHVGSYWTMEVKVGSGSHMWHVHFHILFFTDNKLPTYYDRDGIEKVDLSIASRVTNAWSVATSGAGRVTDMRVFDGNYAEVLKYVSKGLAELPDNEFEQLVNWMKGLRFRGFVGRLYRNDELKQAMLLADDLETEDDLDKIFCPHCGCREIVKKVAVWNYKQSSYRVALSGLSDENHIVNPKYRGSPG